ncbi:hypothetical protein CYLTODRAFT_486127 [Cylindrobasidium torrendii FP15055 ss-10]|uniref:Large ribosomal subunit protein mL59 domain-containing protein n=1 Tax=Cylindrobasidium torrendii FP15055 ss-10 TaxID=1314674 RepID=A0A0D7BQ22_9AGAR|nr:hypothetical protein CYLTODRAFT_486127 [Cylindrobasidium torrendii FP15055 ss-10]
MSASTAAALRTLKAFRMHELRGLESHIARFGFLPTGPARTYERTRIGGSGKSVLPKGASAGVNGKAAATAANPNTAAPASAAPSAASTTATAAATASTPAANTTTMTATATATATSIALRNPFLPFLNPSTGRWAPPKYSLRRQAELVKAAGRLGLGHLLPPGVKGDLRVLAGGLTPKSSSSKSLPGSTTTPQTKESPVTEEWSLNTDTPGEPWLVRIDWVGASADLQKRVEKAERVRDGGRITLYSTRKRMFKGHKWERLAPKKFARRKIMLRDMDARISRWRMWHKHRKPDPVSVPRVKKVKLPF